MGSPKNAIALLSGGLDSSVAMCLAQTQGYQIELAITFDYGQRAARQEVLRAAEIALYFKVPHQSVAISWFSQLQGSGALLNGTEPMPTPTLNDLDDNTFTQASAKAVWVPNRNGVFIEIAAAMAEDRGIGHLIVGFNQEEAKTFPDNTIEYLQAINEALSYSTANKVELMSPTATYTKPEIVRIGHELKFPFQLLWSCYLGGERMCGRCESCMRLTRALQANDLAGEYFEYAHP